MVKLTESMICSRTKVSVLDMVRKLNCWGCELDDIEILQQLPNVEVLSLSVNNIETIWPLAACTNLRELYLRKNNLTEIGELRYLRRLTKLRVLWLSENPCADYPDYRYFVLKTLPWLTTLDNKLVTAEELNAMHSYDHMNGAMEESQQLEESSPECDGNAQEFANVNNGIGWKTVRLPDRQSVTRRDTAERSSMVMENASGMSASCYVPNSSAQSNGHISARHERRNTSTSMNSLYEPVPEKQYSELTTWQQQQQQRSSMTRNNTQSNVLNAVVTLLNELDKQGLELVIHEAEQRLRRM